MVKLAIQDIERLQTWSFPERSEQLSIADTISVTEAAIMENASQISALEPRLKELKRQQELLTGRLAGCKGLLAPIRKLPADILLEIFQICGSESVLRIEQPDWKQPFATTSWRSSANSLPAVCFAWNTLIVNTPSFWSKISVHIDCLEKASLSAGSSADISTSLTTALQRSKGAPLDITIFVRSAWALASAVVRPLLQEVHRWRHLNLALNIQHFTGHGFHEFEDGLCNLETLSICALDVYMVDGKPLFISHSNWFSSVPRLRELEQMDIPSGLLSIPWSQIQKLKAKGYSNSWAMYTEALKAATRLQSLELRLPRNFPVPSHSPIPLPSITSLVVEAPWEGIEFLKRFTFPRLAELVLYVDGSDIRSLIKFLSSVSQTLRRFTLVDRCADCRAALCHIS